MSDIDDIKKKMKGLKELVSPLRPSVEDAVDGQRLGEEDLNEKFSRMNKLARAQERFRRCKSANDVFANFALEAAQETVVEMYAAENSGDRQNAQRTVISYALGKPVDRTINLNAQIGNMDESELKLAIHERLGKLGPSLGLSIGAGDTSSFLVDDGGEDPQGSVKELQAASTVERGDVVSGEVLSEQGED